MSVTALVELISRATSKAEIQAAITTAAAANTASVMGITKERGTSVNVERKRANDAAMEVLNRVGYDASLLTEADKAALRKYSGIGGTDTAKEDGGKGHIHEYYTPTPIAEGIWDGLKAMGFGGGNSLEPSAGAGVFQETKPKSVVMTATEIDKTSSHVNTLLHPEDQVLNQPFEMLAASVEDNTFDSCVGNVPFGSTRGDTARLDPDPASREIGSLHGYFVVRTIDKVKPNGLIGLVVPNGIVSGKDNRKIRQLISMKAEFLGAHRLPSGVFTNSGTSTSTDIIFLRKHSEELAALINDATSATLKDANVIWSTFIDGRWFTSAEGKRFLHGEEEKGYRTTVKNTGELTNEALKEKLSHKFESRIDYDALSLAEPISYTYIAGDEKVINGRHMRFNGIAWDLVKSTFTDGNLDPEQFGGTSTAQIEQRLKPVQNALTLTYAQIKNIAAEFPYLISGNLSDYLKLAEGVDAKYREQVVRACIIGADISNLYNAGATSGDELDEVAKKVRAEIAKYGVLANAPKLKGISAKGSNHLNNYLNAMDSNGNISEFLQGKVEKGNVIAVDKTNAAQLISYMYSVQDVVPVPYEAFLEEYEGEPLSLEQLAAMDDIAIDSNGNIAPMDRATSGEIVKVRNDLILAMGAETNQALIDNYQRQLDAIERKRTFTPMANIRTTMNAKWIPRDLVVEYFESVGYDFTYSKVEIDADGNQFENTAYTGSDGIFTGYRAHEGLGRKARSGDFKFEMQLENHMNGLPVRSGGAKDQKNKDGLTPEQQTKLYKEKIKQLDADFQVWLQQHSRAQEIELLYNDTFNGYINTEHSGAPLGLTNTSGKMENFDYQCAEIRRLSEAGTGICGFGTGLGKTATALGLMAYNTQLGRAKRTALVVPKSVLENWFHESNAFLSADMLKQSMFVGIAPEIDKKTGQIIQETVMEGGKPKLNPLTNEPVMRAKLKELKGKDIEQQLNAIPQSNYKFVIITKDRFQTIPMRPDSLTMHVEKMTQQGLLVGGDNKYKAVVDNHKEAMKNEAFREKYAREGAPKSGNIPYFEDMGFDNIIVDEGHNYRNSYSAGRESQSIQYLPTAPSAKVALDMAIKSQYLKHTYNGRGTVLLTATPTVNSPTDIFNMLSHIMTPEDWGKYGIVDVDDFIRVFGETAPMDVEKLSGEIVTKDALIGFKNLSGLRAIFHRYVNLKEAKDIKETVVIPDIIDINQECEMSDEQSTIYEELRERADALSKMTDADKRIAMEMGEKVDTTFGIIRDMDRVTTDMDLYKRQLTFVFPLSQKDKVERLASDLPEYLESTTSEHNPDTGKSETVKMFHYGNPKRSVQGDAYVLVVHEAYEDEVTSRFSQFDIAERDVSHPVTPKYAKLIENLRTGLEDGKHIVFTEEKSQHAKLKRIIANSLGLNPNVIAIINADTVAGKKKRGEIDEDAEQGSLEEIAIKYNAGDYQILICNKKAEVGVNLHIGTAAVHHLTLPWTPASIKQRNGRGARVGAKQKSINAIYYVGKGSFDEFRLNGLKRKAEWMDKLFNGTDDYMDNADADDAEQTNLLLAKDPAELAARMAATKAKKEAEYQAAVKQRSQIDLANYIKAHHDLTISPTEVNKELELAEQAIKELESRIESADKAFTDEQAEFNNQYRELLTDPQNPDTLKKALSKEQIAALGYWDKNTYKTRLESLSEARTKSADLRKELQTALRKRTATAQKLKSLEVAERTIKQLRPSVEASVKKGTVGVSMDVLTNAKDYTLFKNRLYKVGLIYSVGSDLYRIDSIDNFEKNANATCVFASNPYGSIQRGGTVSGIGLSQFGDEQTVTPSELEKFTLMRNPLWVRTIADNFTKDEFYKYLGTGRLNLGDYVFLAHAGDGFERINKRSFAPENAEKIVYPIADDADLKKRLAKWLIENREATSNSQYHNPTGFYSGILGEDWINEFEQYGNAAPESVINQWGASELDKWRNSVEGRETESLEYRSNYLASERVSETGLRGYLRDNIPTEYSNHAQFTQMIEQVAKLYTDSVNTNRKNKLAAQALALEAKFKQAKADTATQRERLLWLIDTLRDSHYIAYRVLERVRTADVYKAYAVADNPLAVQGAVLADLSALTYQPVSTAGLIASELTTDNSYRGAIEKQCSYFARNAFVLSNIDAPEYQQRIEALHNTENAQKLAEQQRLEREAELAKQLADSTIVDGDITITTNIRTLNNTKFGRWSIPAGEAYAINDARGKYGRLGKIKDLIKHQYEAKYSDGIDSQFQGSWWFVRKDKIELAKLLELLGIK